MEKRNKRINEKAEDEEMRMDESCDQQNDSSEKKSKSWRSRESVCDVIRIEVCVQIIRQTDEQNNVRMGGNRMSVSETNTNKQSVCSKRNK